MAFNPLGKITAADSPSVDAFSRWRVSEPATLFSSQNQYGIETLIWEPGATGTGVTPAFDSNTRMIDLVATAGSGTSFIQSYQYTPYQPGKSQLCFATFVLGTGVAGAVVDVGLFDAGNGIFLRQNGASGLQIVRRTSTSGSVVDNTVAQASWNVDPLDGTGVSGLTLDVTKAQILVIDAQFLGMGRVRVGFDIDGTIVIAHEFLNANNISVPYMQTLSLPVQMLVTATATGSTKTACFKCASISSEGGFTEDIGYILACPEGTVTATTTRAHILSLRPRTTFSGLTNRSLIRLEEIDLFVTGANSVFWELCIGSTFSVAPTFANVNTTYSSCEYGTGGTLTSPGIVIATGYAAASASVKTATSSKFSVRYPVSLDRAGAVRANGTLSLHVTTTTGSSATRASMDWTEIR